ncbi:hypothetical protein CY34DRAFT_485707 [Suillus luteus UH-Slu-Lm8-n1]|uniref:Uncharacterized protein n=1 Tax=Suillus luteus UH-Slu-Lm8-n1 TaxID=930992 RepID=A0A0D0ARL8_9AGAM|nr:hypothetical protein CY34DRAFT_485707 [Suillus luteus UH-Slu-Lm8-n1]
MDMLYLGGHDHTEGATSTRSVFFSALTIVSFPTSSGPIFDGCYDYCVGPLSHGIQPETTCGTIWPDIIDR